MNVISSRNVPLPELSSAQLSTVESRALHSAHFEMWTATLATNTATGTTSARETLHSISDTNPVHTLMEIRPRTLRSLMMSLKSWRVSVWRPINRTFCIFRQWLTAVYAIFIFRTTGYAMVSAITAQYQKRINSPKSAAIKIRDLMLFNLSAFRFLSSIISVQTKIHG